MVRVGAYSTWKASFNNSQSWYSLDTSSNGKYIYAVVNGGFIYSSADYGLHWGVSLQGARSWTSIATSANGQYIYCCSDNTYSYFSFNYGQNWNKTTGINGCSYLATSSSGQYVYMVLNGGNYYFSSDYGQGFVIVLCNNILWNAITWEVCICGCQ